MPTQIQAVQCASCKKLHPETGRNIEVTAEVKEHKDIADQSYQNKNITDIVDLRQWLLD